MDLLNSKLLTFTSEKANYDSLNEIFTKENIDFDNIINLNDFPIKQQELYKIVNDMYQLPIEHIPYNTGDDIYEHIIMDNQSSINEILKQTYNSPVIFIDGVCCNGKTTITSNSREYDYYKHNAFINLQHMNLSPLDSLGYTYSFLEAVDKMKRKTVCDRTCYNNLDWFYMWSALVKYNDNNNLTEAFKVLKNAFNNIHPAVLDKIYSRPTIILVDSDVTENAARLKTRGIKHNIDSDFNRSHWSSYIPLQYYMYSLKRKYKNIIFINYNIYNNSNFNSNFDEFSQAINKVIMYIFNNMKIDPSMESEFSELDYVEPLLLTTDGFDANITFNSIKEIGKEILKAKRNKYEIKFYDDIIKPLVDGIGEEILKAKRDENKVDESSDTTVDENENYETTDTSTDTSDDEINEIEPTNESTNDVNTENNNDETDDETIIDVENITDEEKDEKDNGYSQKYRQDDYSQQTDYVTYEDEYLDADGRPIKDINQYAQSEYFYNN